MRIKPAHEFVAVAAHHLVSEKVENLMPGGGQQNRGIEQYEHQTHHDQEDQETRTAQTPTRLRYGLKHPVITDADCEILRDVLRRDHGTKGRGGSPVVRSRVTVGLAFSHTLSAQPEDVRQQKEKKQERVFLGDAIESDGDRIERPERRRQQRDLDAEKL